MIQPTNVKNCEATSENSNSGYKNAKDPPGLSSERRRSDLKNELKSKAYGGNIGHFHAQMVNKMSMRLWQRGTPI